MKVVEATMTSKGQVTVPASLRKALGLKAGDRLVFIEDAQGRFVVEARTDTLADLRSIVRRDARHPLPIDGARITNWIDESRSARWRRMSHSRKSNEA